MGVFPYWKPFKCTKFRRISVFWEDSFQFFFACGAFMNLKHYSNSEKKSLAGKIIGLRLMLPPFVFPKSGRDQIPLSIITLLPSNITRKNIRMIIMMIMTDFTLMILILLSALCHRFREMLIMLQTRKHRSLFSLSRQTTTQKKKHVILWHLCWGRQAGQNEQNCSFF